MTLQEHIEQFQLDRIQSGTALILGDTIHRDLGDIHTVTDVYYIHDLDALRDRTPIDIHTFQEQYSIPDGDLEQYLTLWEYDDVAMHEHGTSGTGIIDEWL